VRGERGQGDPPHAERLVGGPLRIHQHRLVEPVVLDEAAREERAAVAHEGDARPERLEPCPVAVQLHRLLAAEHSTEVAEEDDHGRALGPEAAERDLAAVGVLERQRCDGLPDELHAPS
jgi:hypothetical protein